MSDVKVVRTGPNLSQSSPPPPPPHGDGVCGDVVPFRVGLKYSINR